MNIFKYAFESYINYFLQLLLIGFDFEFYFSILD